jgi:hypothetical protein
MFYFYCENTIDDLFFVLGLGVLHISKVNWCCLVWLLFVGLYGLVEKRWSSNDQSLHLICR